GDIEEPGTPRTLRPPKARDGAAGAERRVNSCARGLSIAAENGGGNTGDRESGSGALMRDYKAAAGAQGRSFGMAFRVRVVCGTFFLCFSAVLGRAVYLQWHEKDHLQGLAEEQYVRELEIPAKRGDVFDRRGIPLAQSVDVDSIWVDPSLL